MMKNRFYTQGTLTNGIFFGGRQGELPEGEGFHGGKQGSLPEGEGFHDGKQGSLPEGGGFHAK